MWIIEYFSKFYIFILKKWYRSESSIYSYEYFSKSYIFILKKWYESECNIYSYEYEYKFAEVYDHDHLLHFCLGKVPL